MLKKCKSGSGYGLYTCRYGGNNYRVKQRFSKYSDKYDIYEDGVFIDSANTLKACESIIRVRGSRSKRSKVKNSKPNTNTYRQYSTTKIKENVTLLDLIRRLLKLYFRG